jgi:hypothetical protein
VNATLAGRDGDKPPDDAGKRRFGRTVTDSDSFGSKLDGLLYEASESDIEDDAIREALLERAATIEARRAAGDGGLQEEADRNPDGADRDSDAERHRHD